MGPGPLKLRDDPKLHGTDKERQLLAPQDSLYATMGKECVNEGVCVDLWAFPMNAYVDVSTLGKLYIYSVYSIISFYLLILFFLFNWFRCTTCINRRWYSLFLELWQKTTFSSI